MSFENATEDIKALEAKLAGNDAQDSDLKKALADVAKGAIDLAQQQAQTLKKAQDEKKDDEEEEDEDDTAEWLKNYLKENGGEMAKSLKAQAGLQKALDPNATAVDVSHYLQEELKLREADRKEIAALRKSQKKLMSVVETMAKSLDAMQAMYAEQGSALAKGIIKLLDQGEQVVAQPLTTSRFALMEKAVKAQGGKEHTYNKERAVNLLAKGLITPGQHNIWKHTGMLPAGVDLSSAS